MTRPKLTPTSPDWPVAWTTYRPLHGMDADFADLRAHGVGLVSMGARDAADAGEKLESLRRHGMQAHIHVAEITEQGHLVAAAGLTPEPALMIGGAYLGKAIDRHLYTFEAVPQRIIIEPPVYNAAYAYTHKSDDAGNPVPMDPQGHYYPDLGAPLRAEVIVPRRAFDGAQHLTIVPAAIGPAADGAVPDVDSAAGLPPSREVASRALYELSFDLSGLDDHCLDMVGLAVYWAYGGTTRYWIFGRGTVSARAESTREALRAEVRAALAPWAAANGGTFPSETVPFVRFGDECFFITGHSHTHAAVVSFPLWDFSAPNVDAFRASAGEIEHPRTWGFPEVYGEDAYAWWLYNLHEGCAELCEIVREEVAAHAPGVSVFRNTTRMGIFDQCNDHDGSGQELLTRHLDLVHLDPYPVVGGIYTAQILRDMSYCAGLARRYGKPLVPWMQAHTYGGPHGLGHVTPAQVDRMNAEVWAQGVDAVMWLGHGPHYTFPDIEPESWARAGAFHHTLQAEHPPVPKPKLAVLRPYRSWALSSSCDGQVRNPADWLVQQLLEVWAVQHGLAYDVYEVAPCLTPDAAAALDAALAAYPYIVSTAPREGAWVLGEGTVGTSIDPATAEAVQAKTKADLGERGWLCGT